MKRVYLGFTMLPLLLSPCFLEAEEIAIDVSTLESDTVVMRRFDTNGNGTLEEDELDAYVDWIESGGTAAAVYTTGASYVFVRNGVPVRRWVYRPGTRRRWRRGALIDPDNNPPGLAGGAGTNWENPPGAVGGRGASPNRRRPRRRPRR